MTTEREPGGGMKFTLILCGIMMALGIIVFWNYRNTLHDQAANPDRLPIQSQLDKPLEGINHRGENVSFLGLRGKVWVMAYAYLDSPAGAQPLLRKLQELQRDFADEEDVHFVALSSDPDKDTPERMAAWAKADGRDMGGENWWFMTGVAKKVRSYMGKYFRLYVTKRTDPQEIETYGPWEQDYCLVLVDQAGAIRRTYYVLDSRVSDHQDQQIREDMRNLLEHGHNFGGPGRKS